MKKRLLLSLTLLLFLLKTTDVYSQPRAVVDNVYVTPNARNVIWNVLHNDDPDNCTYEKLNMTITVPPRHAQTYGVNAANRITYRPVANFIGRDSLTYQIRCGARTSSAKVYINVNDKPDFQYLDVCHIPPPSIGFAMTKLSSSSQNTSTHVTPVCGDIDNDGETEILIWQGVTGDLWNNVNRLYIFGVRRTNSQVYLKYTINTSYTHGSTPILIANVDNDGYAAVFIATMTQDYSGANARQLIKYKFNGSSYTEQWRQTYSSTDNFAGGVPVIGDFAGDGNAQIVVYDKVYNARTGTLLANGGYLGTAGYNFGRIGHGIYLPSAAYPRAGSRSSMVTADIDGDGLPEVIGGDCVYKVNITNHSGTSGNSFTFLRRANAGGRPEVINGSTSVGDIDGDGLSDIVVTAHDNSTDLGYVYVYNPRTGDIMNTNTVSIPANRYQDGSTYQRNGPSLAFCGDLDNDGRLEICLTGEYVMRAYRYIPTPGQSGRGTLSQMWSIATNDPSASTTMSLFDFTQDGKARLVYRDTRQLRIIDGETGSTLSTIANSYSYTMNESPIIADVNGDGAAEIIDSSSSSSSDSGNGFLSVYGASGVEKWAPARKVWNQYGYNPVYVNDDLTIPRYPLNPATKFTEANGTVHQPFNNFLQQATLLNDEGRDLWLGADLAFDRSRRPQMSYDAGSGTVTFTIYVGNVGDRAFPSPLRIGLYGYVSATRQYIKLNVQSITLVSPIAIGETRTLSFSVANFTNLLPDPPRVPDYNQLYVCINAIDNPGAVLSAGPEPSYYFNTTECHSHNNDIITTLAYGERVMCEGTTETVNVATVAPGTYLYRWYERDNPVPFHEGDSYAVTKDSRVLQQYLINTYTRNGQTKLNAAPDTVNIYLFPDSLVWTGAANNRDWHDYDNWYNPNSSLYPQSNIPRKCTNVLIPEGLEYYPDLIDKTAGSGFGTDYETYSKSECADITFEHSARVVRTDLLDYDRAFVQLRLAGNRNYMLAAPLQHFYTGDYYVKDRNPVQDDIIAYTSLFSRSNPQTSSYVEGAWTGLFNNPDYLFGAGSGIRLWADDKQPNANIHNNVTFLFPKHDPVHSIFNRTSGAVVSNYPVARGNEHRFIYEPKLNVPTGDIPMDSVYAKNANVKVLVGNPFMAYLDFNLFYQKNQSRIKSTYQIITENGSTVTFDALTGIGTDPMMDQYIPPMQSFWVESLTAFSELQADVTMASPFGDATLRSTGGPARNDESMLTIELSGNGTGNRTLLICSPEASNRYNDDGEDATKIFMAAYPEAVSVYTRSSDGYYLDIDRIGDLSEIVPVGIHTLLKGSYRLNFDGVWNFPADTHIWLNERRSDGSVFRLNLSAGCHYYDFEKTDDKIYENDRFYLSFEPSATGLQTPEAPDRKIIGLTSNDGSFKIFTSDGSPLTRIELFDLQGRKLQSVTPERSEYILHPALSGIYIVRARSTTASRSFKIYAK